MKFLASSLALLAFLPVATLAGSAPVNGVKIQLRNVEDTNPTLSPLTHAGGRFTLKGLAPGICRLYISKNGFVDRQCGQKPIEDQGERFELNKSDQKNLTITTIPPPPSSPLAKP